MCQVAGCNAAAWCCIYIYTYPCLHQICGYRLPDCEQGYFTFYVVLIFIWALVAAAVAITLPIIESRAIVFAFLGSFPGLGFLKAYAERTAAAKDAKHEVGSCLLV